MVPGFPELPSQVLLDVSLSKAGKDDVPLHEINRRIKSQVDTQIQKDLI